MNKIIIKIDAEFFVSQSVKLAFQCESKSSQETIVPIIYHIGYFASIMESLSITK
jgi:hypothetical protein